MVAESLAPPTIRLPPIAKLASLPPELLIDALRYLRILYNPEVRGSRKIKRDAKLLLPLNPNLEPKAAFQDELDLLRADAFERTYTLRWLTALISYTSASESSLVSDLDPVDAHLADQYDAVLGAASSLLAVCAGTSAAGSITRVFAFSHQIQVTLTDAPLENQNFESVGVQTWGGACVLSELVVEQPATFGLVTEELKGRTLRVLELGAGTGLVSLTLAKLLENMEIRAEIIATDFYPLVLANLESNVAANSLPPASTVSISSHFLDWSTFPNIEVHQPPFNRTFDLILGADIIYEASHAIWIKSCLRTLLSKAGSSSALPQATFHLVIPLRSTHAMESQTIEEIFPLASAHVHVPCPRSTDLELVVLEKEVVLCEAGEGRREQEVEYGYYKIGWGFV